jgi:hypothetical protein
MASPQNSKASVGEHTKALLVDPLKLIELDDYINGHLRKAMADLSLEKFSPNGVPSNEEFTKRITTYETAIANLQTIVILLARWGNSDHLLLLEKIFSRLAEVDKGSGGTIIWLRLGWYPLVVLMYAAGIAALSARRYEALHIVLSTPVPAGQVISGNVERPIVLPALTAMNEIVDSFKWLPGHDQHRVPRSEHLFERMRPTLDDALLLGSGYETLFDRFESLLALAFADFTDPSGSSAWGPLGRFSWKTRYSGDPVALLIAEATEQGNAWPMLTTGLFGGKSERFLKIAVAFKQLLDRSSRW